MIDFASIGALIVAIASVMCFSLVLVRSRILTVAREISSTSTAGVTAMLDSSLDDDAKERIVRDAGLQLIKLSGQVGWRILLALAAVGVPVVAAGIVGLVPQEDSLGILMRADFIVVVSVLAIGLGFVRRPRKRAEVKAPKVNDTNSYGSGDRLIHALAFSGPKAQKAFARIDDRLFSQRIAETAEAPPVFITSLARGGTTALLNALHDMPELATHRYADMPFLTAPMLWSRMSGHRTQIVERERSHGDGMKIGLQSPEAFDEVFWMLHWPEKYHETHIDLWQGDEFKAEAQAFFKRHFAKIAQIRHPNSSYPVRYLSKNNANIARLPVLPKLFPGCQIIVPLREPSAHAASLYRQHKNFTKLHAEDSFSKRYMRDIGHFEFGELHRPMDFARDFLRGRDLEQPDYWLAYWITCFEHIAHRADKLLLVKQDDLRRKPAQTMEHLVASLGLSHNPSKQWDSYFRREEDAAKDHMFDGALLDRAREVYAHLCSLVTHKGIDQAH
ncbi:sulfotransferase [Salipiger mangrovisoli]|uniref:Sulfotransferase n=1 Tax=Salipiger mangrovisoli TaxID=2865933 RepID=A0ABR9XBU7_9RHOB|nr:sulfotransferase [Salipiger mangrovisoli]MBE9640957.1 sulfotransferase [Salipiger mangrovisoli]